MTPEPTEQPQSQDVGPAPVPQNYRIHQATYGAQQLVAIQLTGPCGQWIVFFDPDGADEFADKVKANAREARSGLTIAHSMPPASANGHGGPPKR